MIEEKLTEEGIMSGGLCLHKPETKCDKNYECKKLDEAHAAYMRGLHKEQRIGKNPFAYHTTFHATSEPGFVCPNKLSDELKKILGIK